jgi:hypothetical protein
MEHLLRPPIEFFCIGGLRLRPSAKAGLAAERTIRPAARRLISFIGVFQASVRRAMQRPCRVNR